MENLEEFITRFGDMSEEYSFYGGEVTLRYYDDEHAYYLLDAEGNEEKQDGVTTVCHIIDKSDALVPWGCKMMAQKLMTTIPGTRSAGAVVMSEAELEEWVTKGKSAHKEKLEEAGKTGHIAHNHIENYIKLVLLGELHLAEALRTILPYDERAAKGCQAAFEWMDRHNVRWISTEQKIYSRKYKYAGTLDGLCTCDSCLDPKCCPEEFFDRLTVADWKTSNYLYLEYLLQTAAYENAFEEESGLDVKDRWIIRLDKDSAEFEAWHLQEHNFEEDFGGFLATLDLTRRVKKLQDRLKKRKDDLRAALKAEKAAQKATKEREEATKKAIDKAEKLRSRMEALAKECKTARNYKAIRFPACKTRDGKPCETCQNKWDAKHGKANPDSINMLESILGKSIDKQIQKCSTCQKDMTYVYFGSGKFEWVCDSCILDLDKS